MTDETNNTPADLVSPTEAIATLRAGRLSHPLATGSIGGHPVSVALRTAADAQLSPEDMDALAEPGTRRRDDVVSEIAALDKRAAELNAKISETRRDSRGNQIPMHSQGQLDAFNRELHNIAESRGVAVKTKANIEQRDAQQIARERVHVENDAAEFEFHENDPVKKQALEDAKLRLEADAMAQWLLRRRHNI